MTSGSGDHTWPRKRWLGYLVVIVLLSWLVWYFLLPDDSDECDELGRRDWSALTQEEQDWWDSRCNENG